MARRSEAQREQMREKVLELARKLIEEKGPDAISARNLAKRVGMLPGSLYNLFPSVEHIRLSALGDVLKRLKENLAGIPRDRRPDLRLHDFARAYLAFVHKNQNAWNALLDYRRNATMPAPDWYQAHISQLTSMIADCFSELSPDRPSEQAEVQAQLLWAGIYGLSALSAEGRLDTTMGRPLDQLVNGLVDTHIAAFTRAEFAD